MTVGSGPEPTVIQWETLHVGAFSRFIRTAFVTLITIVLLIISVGGIVLSQNYQNIASTQFNIS